jgi:O-antigen/teichoic acid export membrane protein
MTAASSSPGPAETLTARRVLRQGTLVLAGGVAVQILAFARNAALAHVLSMGDFGLAMALLVTLQLVEALGEFGPERVLAQGTVDDAKARLAALHGMLMLRGLAMAAILFLTARPVAALFNVPAAAATFEALAVIPLLKACLHLGHRLDQRALDNRAGVLIELIPQGVTAILALPVAIWLGDASSVIWLAMTQAILTTLLSHVMARHPYAVSFQRPGLIYILAFAAPMWLAAIPHAAVFQGERALVGHLFGIEALAQYSAAFLLTGAPMLVIARLASGLALPLLTRARDDTERARQTWRAVLEVAVLAAAVLMVAFVIAGQSALVAMFGRNYTGLHDLVMILAAVAAIRIVQAAPANALFAHGLTTPILHGTLMRAIALPLMFALAASGAPLAVAAGAAALGELASLAVVVCALPQSRMRWQVIRRIGFVPLAAMLAMVAPRAPGLYANILPVLVCSIAVVGAATLVFPGLRRMAYAARSAYRR